METLPKDLKRKVALELSPPDLISFCASEKKTNSDICESEEFWRLKIARDFPEVFLYFQNSNLTLRNPKNTYMKKFAEVSKLIEAFIREHPSNPEKEKQMYKDLYDMFYRYRFNWTEQVKRNFLNKYKLYKEKSTDEWGFKVDLNELVKDLKRLYDVYTKQ